MLSYDALKTLHVATVVISGSLFAYRVFLRLVRSQLAIGWLRIAPHVNDSLLLVLAMSMLYVANINPVSQSWIQAKIGALIVYILLGVWSLRAPTDFQCGVRAIPAFIVFGYIVGVALTKSAFVLQPL